jgi:predicted transposase YdaD
LGLVGLLPLLPLTHGGKNPEVVEEAITSIQARGGKSAPELLSLTYILASLVFKQKAEQEWLDRRFGTMRDILQDTWAYKKIKKEGLEEGRREGRQEGLQQGRQQALHEALEEQRQTLLEIVRGRFPAIEQQAKRTADTITDLAVLRTMIVKLSLTQTEEAARQILLEKGMG